MLTTAHFQLGLPRVCVSKLRKIELLFNTGDARRMNRFRSLAVLAMLLVSGNVAAAQADSTSTSRALDQDTLPRRRVSVQYSEGYGTRAAIHRRLSYTMLPLFAASYFSGEKLFKEGSTASSFTKYAHRGSATAVTVLFGVNAVTGGINLWQGRHDPAMRKRKILHAVLFTAASAGFSYAGSVLANQAETSLSKRQAHRNLNLFSMGLSGASVLLMTVGPNR